MNQCQTFYLCCENDCWLLNVQVNSTKFTSNVGTNGGAIAMQSVTNVTLTGITAVGNTAGYGGGMLIDRAALVQVLTEQVCCCPCIQRVQSSKASCLVKAQCLTCSF